MNRFFSFTSRHRTKLLGGAQIAAGAITTQLPQLQSVLKPLHYGVAMMVVGTSTAVLGFINTGIINSQNPPA